MEKRGVKMVISLYCYLFLIINIAKSQSNHIITIGDATNDYTNATENIGTETGITSYLTWDATNLYIGFEGNPIVNRLSNLYIVFDTDPATNDDSRSGNGRTDQPTAESGGATYPFNADYIYRFYGTNSNDATVQNPAPGDKFEVSGSNWISNSIVSGVRILRHDTNISDIEIPFSELGLSAGSTFNILIYVANSGTSVNDQIFAQWPTNNPDGNALTDANGGKALTHYFTFDNTTGITPNSQSHLSIRTYASSFTFGESSLANVSLIGGGQTYSAGSLTNITRNLYIGNSVTFSMGSNTSALSIGGNLRNEMGALTLSTNFGGDLYIGGNWENNSMFIDNTRQVTFNGTGTQTITNSNTEVFSYFEIDKTNGKIDLINDIEINARLLFGPNNTQNITSSTGSKLIISNATADDPHNGVTFANGTGTVVSGLGNAKGRGMVTVPITRNIGMTTGSRFFPLGDGSDFKGLILYVDSSPTNTGSLTISYNPNGNTISSVSIIDNGTTIIYRTDANWTISANTLTGGTYGLMLRGDGLNVADINHLRICLANSVVGTHTAGSGTTTEPEANRTAIPLADLSNSFYVASTDQSTLPLPVELTDFYGNLQDERIELYWNTQNEINNDYFTIEKSENGIDFTDIGEVLGYGNSNEFREYHFTDDYPNEGENYYRLKQVDYDGSFEYSNTIIINYEHHKQQKIYPNPAKNFITIPIFEKNQKKIRIQILNPNGQLIQNISKENNLYKANNIEIDISNLAKGMYFVRILTDNHQFIHLQSFLKF